MSVTYHGVKIAHMMCTLLANSHFCVLIDPHLCSDASTVIGLPKIKKLTPLGRLTHDV